MENIEIILDGYYSALYWRAFFYGVLIPTLIYSTFVYLNYRMINRHLTRFEALLEDSFNKLIIQDLQRQEKFFIEIQKILDENKPGIDLYPSQYVNADIPVEKKLDNYP